MRKIEQRGIFQITIAALTILAASAALARSDPFVLREIARGAEIHGANGMYFDAQDRLHIASNFGREIVVMDRLTGKILDRLGTDDGIEMPDDLVFGPDGSLYWTSIYTGIVGRRRPDGTTVTQFVGFGANPITLSSSGRLFTALDFLGDGLYELDPNLAGPPRPIIEATPQNPYPLGFLNGFDFGPDGRLYGPLFAVGIVISIDVDSCENTTNPWADCDIQVVATGFPAPVAAKFDSSGRLFVIDNATGEVNRVNVSTGQKTLITTLPPGLDNLAFDSRGELYVSNFADGTVTHILPNNKPRVLNKAGMIIPGGVAVIPGPKGHESVFVADLASLRQFDGRTGLQQGHWVGSLTGQGLLPPLTASVDGEHLVLTSQSPPSVQVWDPKTNQILEQYSMALPLNAIRFRNDIVAADPLLGGVVWASNRQLILGQPNVFLAAGLAANEDTLWVADWATGIIWQVPFSGNTPQTPVPIAIGLANPEGLALDTDGSLLVVEAGAGRLSRIDLEASPPAVTTVADGLELGAPAVPVVTPPTWAFNGVAVGPSGAIYITGDKSNVLYRMWPR